MASNTPPADPRVSDLVRAGMIRVALFPPQFTKDAATAEMRGPYVEIVRALAEHIGVRLMLTEVANPEAMIRCLDANACDVGSLGFDPSRASQVEGFTRPFMRVEYSHLVPAGSAIRACADVDRPGIRIAAVRGHASTLTLGRILKRAQMVSVDTPDAAFTLLRDGAVDAWASVRPALDYSARHSSFRVLADGYGANLPAFVVAKGQAGRLAYVSEFVDGAIASGAARRAIEQAGEAGFMPAPLGRR